MIVGYEVVYIDSDGTPTEINLFTDDYGSLAAAKDAAENIAERFGGFFCAFGDLTEEEMICEALRLQGG